MSLRERHVGFHTQAVYHTMRKVWEDGASSGEVGTFFCEVLSTARASGIANMERGSSPPPSRDIIGLWSLSRI